ncbi:hypothetical protein hmeg3_05365 [Herbaspirillum sp. meg3]|uniref:hypothetical protein n=1 Tax=Herbaspirillum sp. meg3 TaxID=2025949 RepID=UPI000B98B54B|nr:hypothetical protein [Herbaspirillum sp. meg3]ASU37779.1 hypothetical protein hmeg3_05365 [Herbaspirillum sp. meg3]
MSVNDDTSNRSQLEQLAKELRKMHKQLIDHQSKNFGDVGNPFEHLQLVTMHPDFAWLRILSEFMVALDERLDDKEPIDDAAVTAFKQAVEGLIGPAEASQPEFRQKYLAVLHDSPDTTMVHGGLRLALGRLARPAKP